MKMSSEQASANWIVKASKEIFALLAELPEQERIDTINQLKLELREHGFFLLSDKEQQLANEMALKYLNLWLRANKREAVTMEEAYYGDRQSDIGTLRYRAQDCREGREFLAALREYQSKRLDERNE